MLCCFSSQRGFTLIEVLIGMTLLSMMVTLLFSSLMMCGKSWEQGEAKMAQVNQMATTYHFFQRHLTKAMPLWRDADDKGEALFSFQGDEQKLEFVSTFPASAERSGSQLFTLNWEKNNKQSILTVGVQPFFTDPKQISEADFVDVLNSVDSFELSYFGLDADTGEYRWQKNWLHRDTMPRLVKVSIAIENQEPWSDIIIPLKIEGLYSGADMQAAN